jgi:hypothetical protein
VLLGEGCVVRLHDRAERTSLQHYQHVSWPAASPAASLVPLHAPSKPVSQNSTTVAPRAFAQKGSRHKHSQGRAATQSTANLTRTLHIHVHRIRTHTHTGSHTKHSIGAEAGLVGSLGGGLAVGDQNLLQIKAGRLGVRHHCGASG